MNRLALSILCCALFMSATTAAGTGPRIGLVLSGGGARGSAHIGVLKVLEEMRIPVHAIAGTSMGSLVGGAYASGVSPTEMEQRVTSMDWNDLLVDDPPRERWPIRRKQGDKWPTMDFTIGRREGEFRLPKGAISGQKVQLFFADLVKNAEGVEHYDELPIPYRAVATNLENGRIKVFDSGDLPSAMRASMSVPGVFSPMELDGGMYVDGGLVRNLPVDIVRSMGVDAVIAVNLGSSYLKREQLGTILGVAGQMIVILTEQNVENSLRELDKKKDVLILPDLGDITARAFERAPEAIAAGEVAARSAAGQLARFSVGEAAYTAWRNAYTARIPSATDVVDEVRVTSLDYVNPDLFDEFEQRLTERKFDRMQVEDNLHTLYGRGDFERLNYRIQRERNRNLLIVDALEKAWGPGYLSLGLGLSSDFAGDNRFGIRGTYRQTWINRRGAEWVTDVTIGNDPSLYTEFFQPFSLDHAGFVAPYLDLGSTPVSVYTDGDRIARYDVSSYRIGADLGTTFGTRSELRVGAFLAASDFSVDTGDKLLPEGSLNESGARAGFVYDQLDSFYWPRKGMRLDLDYDVPLEAFGADMEYQRLEANWIGAVSRGDHALVVNLRGGSSFGDTMPLYRQFELGGFLNLSGYANEEFRGNQLAHASVAYYWRLTTLKPPFGRGLYLGGSLEYGRLWDVALDLTGDPLNEEKNRYGSSLFFGADTWLGPFYMGLGLSGEGDGAFYVLLGRP